MILSVLIIHTAPLTCHSVSYTMSKSDSLCKITELVTPRRAGNIVAFYSLGGSSHLSGSTFLQTNPAFMSLCTSTDVHDSISENLLSCEQLSQTK